MLYNREQYCYKIWSIKLDNKQYKYSCLKVIVTFGFIMWFYTRKCICSLSLSLSLSH